MQSNPVVAEGDVRARTTPARGAPARFTIEPRGPFSLAASASFLAGFTPAGAPVSPAGAPLRLAFPLDGSHEAVGVSLREEGGVVHGAVVGTADVAAARRQVARILSLDHDGSAFLAVGERDPVVGRLQAAYPGLRPVCFHSPYEAAAWAILANRISMRQAARIRGALAARHGAEVVIDGERLRAFPAPARLVAIEASPGLPEEKLLRLRGVAAAALEGRLDADRLRAMPAAEALGELERLRGIGAWGSAHVLLRGAGAADEPAFAEPRVVRGYVLASGLAREPGRAELERIAERWRPYRTWVSVLCALHLSRSGQWAGADRRGRRG